MEGDASLFRTVQVYQIILMDMMMPVMNGCDATKAIRKAGVEIPVVAMTANASTKDRDLCMQAGMNGFLSKPVLKPKIAEAILAALDGQGWSIRQEGLM